MDRLEDILSHYKIIKAPSPLLCQLWASNDRRDAQKAGLLIALMAKEVDASVVLDSVIEDVMVKRTGHGGVSSPL